MKILYKNKRDFFKAEMDKALGRQKELQDQIERERRWRAEEDKKRESDKKSRYSAIVYCSNCQVVSRITIPNGVEIAEADCVFCRVRSSKSHITLCSVKSYPI